MTTALNSGGTFRRPEFEDNKPAGSDPGGQDLGEMGGAPVRYLALIATLVTGREWRDRSMVWRMEFLWVE